MSPKVKSIQQQSKGGVTKVAKKEDQQTRLNVCASYDDGNPTYYDMMLSDGEFFFGEGGFFS